MGAMLASILHRWLPCFLMNDGQLRIRWVMFIHVGALREKVMGCCHVPNDSSASQIMGLGAVQCRYFVKVQSNSPNLPKQPCLCICLCILCCSQSVFGLTNLVLLSFAICHLPFAIPDGTRHPVSIFESVG
ncbi:hypothetical protein AAC387_Pa09g1238 [Persea americana]